MTVERYAISFVGQDVARGHFELRHDEENRPFHLKFRGAERQLAVNRYEKGRWGEEIKLDGQEVFDTHAPVTVEIDDRTCFLRVGRAPRREVAHLRASDLSADVHAVNVHWRRLPQTHACRRDRSVEWVNFGGQRFEMSPLWRRAGLKEDQIATLIEDIGEIYEGFLGTRVLPSSTVIVDDFPGHLPALFAARMRPDLSVYCVCKGKVAAALEETATRNGLTNLKAIPMEEMAETLKAHAGSDVLLQGAEIMTTRDALRRTLDTMDGQLHLFAQERKVVPANRIFGTGSAANVHVSLTDGQRWRLDHHAIGATQPRRNGVDVVVAAYNATDHLVECVDSLLCAGRDDVRVIVVDDGSTDETASLTTQHYGNDPRVSLVSKPNGGCASARNYGRISSDATHIAFVDADDFVTAGFFADLYDLACYTGGEMVQGGFDYHDATRANPFYPSIEAEAFAGHATMDFGGRRAISLEGREVMRSQPTIWRRVYRRDFLDARKIAFPENVRAYDDYIFHLLSLNDAGQIWMLPDHLYHYRQHPAQDIRSGDERHLYVPFMFAQILKRSVDEGWPDFVPVAESIMDTINWSVDLLRPDLIEPFLRASARICVHVRMTYGARILSDALIGRIRHPDFKYHFEAALTQAKRNPEGPHWAMVAGPLQHPDLVRMQAAGRIL